jgi:hypothetical protein
MHLAQFPCGNQPDGGSRTRQTRRPSEIERHHTDGSYGTHLVELARADQLDLGARYVGDALGVAALPFGLGDDDVKRQDEVSACRGRRAIGPVVFFVFLDLPVSVT